ncbi:hypothetical protein [Leptolyngbya sp. PCC 6406]|uniref:hypothetical protein n=1 Tax=Leptolyngbya sp. PCC 6406 TaxID=1173264 RepID=UPI0012DE540E|nr:hypothetical protein [Leptolyngbya sp. PCC 6406]
MATASVTQKRRPWNRGGIKMGSMLLVSVLLHGIVLSLPMVETAPPDEVVVEEEAVVDVMDVAVLPVPRELPQPDLAEEVSPPTPSDPPAPKPQAPVRPEATAPAPSAPSAPEAQADAEDAQNPDPVPPDPIAESLPDPDPQRVGGLTLPSGGEMVNDPTDILSGAHLDRYRRDGNTDPNIEGQFLVALAANEDPRDVVEHFANELGITDSIPRGARQTRDNLPQSYRFKVTTTTGEERLLTLDPVRNRNQVLITIWREFPL